MVSLANLHTNHSMKYEDRVSRKNKSILQLQYYITYVTYCACVRVIVTVRVQ